MFMSKVTNTKISTTIFVLFTIMLILVLFIGSMGLFSIHSMNRSLDDMYRLRVTGIDYLVQADRDLQQLLVAERSLVFTSKKNEVFENLLKDYEENLQQAKGRFQKYKEKAGTDAEKALIIRHEETRQVWEKVSRKVINYCDTHMT